MTYDVGENTRFSVGVKGDFVEVAKSTKLKKGKKPVWSEFETVFSMKATYPHKEFQYLKKGKPTILVMKFKKPSVKSWFYICTEEGQFVRTGASTVPELAGALKKDYKALIKKVDVAL